MKVAFVVRWTDVRPGREGQGVTLAREADEYFGRLAADGKCTEPKWLWSRTGPSIWFVEGELEDLLAIDSAPETLRLSMKGSLVHEGLTQEICVVGREEMLQPWEQLLGEMKLI